jgi:hypothetical protein
MASLLPPYWFVDNFNAGRAREGLPAVGLLDPLVVLAWYLVTSTVVKPQPLCLITGVQ